MNIAIALAVLSAISSGPAEPSPSTHASPADCPMHAKHGPSASSAETPASPQAKAANPYAGFEARRLKSLSEAEIEGIEAGRGFGLALPAELNHYPGPRHALDIASELSMSPDQIAATKALYEDMRKDALRIGRAYLEAERALEEFFTSGDRDAARMQALVAEAGRLRSELRSVHLLAHVAMRRLLTAEQIARYDALRGYAR